MVKYLLAMQEIRVRSLGWEDPLEKGMATHSSILAWRTPWIGEPGGYTPWGHKESDTTEQLTRRWLSLKLSCLFFPLFIIYHLLLEYQLYRKRDLGFLFNFCISIVWVRSSVFMIYSVTNLYDICWWMKHTHTHTHTQRHIHKISYYMIPFTCCCCC